MSLHHFEIIIGFVLSVGIAPLIIWFIGVPSYIYKCAICHKRIFWWEKRTRQIKDFPGAPVHIFCASNYLHEKIDAQHFAWLAMGNRERRKNVTKMAERNEVN